MWHCRFRSICLLVLIIALIVIVLPAIAMLQTTSIQSPVNVQREFRRWTTPVGTQEELALVRYELGDVVLENPSGVTHRFSVQALGEADQQWIADYLETLWAQVVLDEEAMDPITLEWIEMFGRSTGSQSAGPFGESVTPIQMGGDPRFTPKNISRKYGIPEQRTMTDVDGPERDVVYFVYGPLAIGTKPGYEDEVWVRVDPTLADEGLAARAEAALNR